ncbi:hypothetical protein [Virgibacillus ihumii]|uniref:hypothetical protein n=1 Tax=Virgibacillus ihumii TaxID=2686091 RepID=UPI00157D4D1B|nr:hypothetical protein [Virgibacillus ihumii]
MIKVLGVFSKFIVGNLAVILSITLLPVFLVTDDVALFDQIMNYLFSNNNR